MKKYMVIFIASCLVLFASSYVYAANGLNPSAGADVVITDNTGSSGGGPLTFEPSPTTRVGWQTAANEFSLVTWSASNETNDKGNAYCASSGTTNIYKKLLSEGVPTAAAAPGSTLEGFN